MAQLNGFDAHEVEPNQTFDVLPAGKYLAIITASEMKATKAGTGEFLELQLEVVEGPYKGRKLWDRLTLKHENALTVQIAKGTLSSICRAVGVMRPRDSAELHGIPLLAKVKVKQRSDTGESVNEIAGYERKAPAAPSPVPSTSSTPPWKR
ncbi:MAG: DUF669 domain-containing protein [Phycisphaerales bacterium]|nr:DUF669 domain-containing protein [Phycisphaerales bacterium]